MKDLVVRLVAAATAAIAASAFTLPLINFPPN
jgi:hypothetical protein